MTAPLATPLILTSDLSGFINATANTLAVQLALIIQESDRLQGLCARRFDERIDTRYFTPTGMVDTSGVDLLVDDDLRTVTAIVNGDGTAITTGYTVLPKNDLLKDRIRLNPYGTQYWYYGALDPVDSVAITGTWGYGGGWVTTGATLTTLSSTSGTALVSSASLTAGMTLRIDSEYLYVNAVAGSTSTVDRATNGSTAATHSADTVIYRWQSDPLVQKLVRRLVLVSVEQDKSPLFGSVVIGDFAAPVATDSVPKDVLYDIKAGGLKRQLRIRAV